MTEAGHRSTPPGLEKQFLLAAYELLDPRHAEGLISMDKVGHQMGQMGLLKEKEKKDRDLLKRMTKLHIKLGNLAQDSNTEEVGLFRFTPKGLEMARWLRGG